MSTSHASAQDAQAAQAERRRKRKERAKSRTPEPKNIVSGAGQPLDLSVRRELEEQLGHDFSQVRLHTDRDAGALTEMLGADAVAVGQDIFFREGAYRPGTADGQRLLAHELLHTVQNPHGLGALRAGRDVGAVSLPQQAMEREAESAAQDLVRDGLARDGETAADVAPGQATPGWLRYATVDADRRRLEEMDPATLLDRMANGVLRSLRGDPQDLSKRVRTQLARLSEEMQDAVLDRLELRLLSAEHEHLIELVEETEAAGLHGQDPSATPEALPDALELLEEDRDRARLTQANSEAAALTERERPRTDTDRREEETPRDTEGAPAPDEHQGSSPGGGGTPDSSRAPGSTHQNSTQSSGATQAKAAAATAPGSSSASRSGQSRSGQEKGGSERTSGKAAAETPASGKESAADQKRPAAESAAVGQQSAKEDKRGDSDRKSAGVEPGALLKTADLGARSTLDGKRLQDEEAADEDPFSLEAGLEGDFRDLGEEDPEHEDSAWDVELQAEDFVPESDLDVSGVPTADGIAPGSDAQQQLPSFPSPPPTKAEQVQAQREEEDARDAGPDTDEFTSPVPTGDGAAVSPVAQGGAGNRGASFLRDAKPVDQELAPAPGAGRMSAPEVTSPAKSGPEPEAATDEREPSGTEDKQAEPEQVTREPDRAAEQRQTERAAASSGSSPTSGSPDSQTTASSGTTTASSGTTASSAPATGQATGAQSSPAGDTAPAGHGGATEQAAGSSPASDGNASGTGGGNEASGSGGSSAPAPAAAAAAPARTPAPARPRSTGPAPRTRGGGGGTRRASGGGGGGGGARAAAPSKAKSAAGAPNLSQVSPEAGLSTAAQLKPHRALEALGGVNGAVDRSVGQEHQALRSAPPTMERPAGAPQTLHGAPTTSAPGEYSGDPAAKVDSPEQEEAKVEGDKAPEGEIPGMDIEEPSTLEGLLAGGAQLVVGAINGIASAFGADEDVIDSEAVVRWILDLPTEDEMLAKASVGMAPGVGMEGETGGRADEQGTEVDNKGRQLHSQGQSDAARPLGEDQVYPDVPQETLTSKVPGARGQGGGAGGAAAAAGRIPPEAVSEVAEHERGPQLQAAYSDGQKTMSAKRQVKDRDTQTSRQRHKEQVRTEIDTNTRAQATEREKTKLEVARQRQEWRTEQDTELNGLGTKKSDKIQKLRQEVTDREKQTDEKVEGRRKTNEQGIGTETKNAQDKAVRERDTAKNNAGSWLSEAFDWIRKKLIELKNAIIEAFRLAREAVVKLITDFKGTVLGWINDARKFIVEKFKQFTEALIQLAKDLLDAILKIATRIRNLIIRIRDAAIALVNRIANELKRMLNGLLNRIAKILSDILDALKEGLRLAVQAVMAAVKAIMDFALGLLNALGEWAMIAADIIMDPGAWLSGAAASAEDGARNHLFREVTSAVKNWFNEKIQEVLGLPKQIFDALLNGGVSKEQMAKEAWDAALPQLPVIIGEVVVTKIIAKLIPGAGWVMAVIDALKSAWGALSEILKAFGAFMDYLKAVKGGNAGVLFAKAVASGVVALLELAYEALLSGIGKYVKKVGDRLRGVAAKLRKPGAKDPARPDQSDKPTTPNAPGAPKDPTRPNPPDRPQATEQPKAGAGASNRPDKKKEAEQAQQKTKQANDELKTPKRPSRPTRPARPRPTRAPARPAARRDTPAPRPDTRRPDRTPDNRRTNDRDQDRTRPRRETEGTKPSPRRRDPSPERRANDRARQTVKSAQDRNRRARRDLDRNNDRDNRRRRDLDNNDRRMRDAYRRRRDLLRDQQKRREEQKRRQRDERRRKENSEESKQDRLARIVARIRPKLRTLLRRGIQQRSMRSLLSAMRAWYRLTQLLDSGAPSFSIRAVLNPSADAARGRARTPEQILAEDPAATPEQILAGSEARATGIDEWILYYDPDSAESLRAGLSRILAVQRHAALRGMRPDQRRGEEQGVYIDARARPRADDGRTRTPSRPSSADRSPREATVERPALPPGRQRRTMSAMLRAHGGNRGTAGEKYVQQELRSGKEQQVERVNTTSPDYAGEYPVEPTEGGKNVRDRKVDLKDRYGEREQLIEVKNYQRYNSNYKEMKNGREVTRELFVPLEGEKREPGWSGRPVTRDQISKDWRIKRNKQRAGVKVDVIWVFPDAHPSPALRAALAGAGFTIVVLS
ncbi:eCIS core domain-containing protein [Streptomyces sp. NPDC054841]